MNPAKGILIKEITDNQSAEGLFLVKTMARAETRTGKPYLMLTVMDNSGEMAARVWEEADRYAPDCQPGKIIFLSAHAQAYRGELQLKINAIHAVDDPSLDMSLFLPATDLDIPTLTQELVDIVESIKDRHVTELLQSFFSSAQFMHAFTKAPAAKMMHHAYIGGLLEHTVSVARLAEMVSTLYPTIDRSLLLAGAMLHDIGKIKEFSYEVYPFDYSAQGRLMGHMVLGVEMIQERIAQLADFPESYAVMIKHLILSHHGQHEFGSPTLPMTLEAFVLHFLDDLDSKVNYINRLAGQKAEPGYQWTDFQRNLERFLLVQGHDGHDSANISPDKKFSADTVSSGPEDRQKNQKDTKQIHLFTKK